LACCGYGIGDTVGVVIADKLLSTQAADAGQHLSLKSDLIDTLFLLTLQSLLLGVFHATLMQRIGDAASDR